MKHVKALSLGLAVVAMVGVALIALKPVLASSYEYIKGVYLSPSSSLHAGQYVTTTYETVTTGSYDENRTAYYSVGSSSGPWTEWTNCRRSGTMNGNEVASCAVMLPSTAATTTLYVRASTNFSGCGSWTPTPDEMSCGGTQTVSYPFSP